ncbi:probetacellulin [Cololabis saira]|uniref:probetacellulin n=1 Tax=Cololabis saira TaxID=129043 RepID=UPI002AD497B7|nr:probetacellulin [Cololabis saira]
MGNMYRLIIRLLTALVLCLLCRAEWNSTDVSVNRTVPHCHLHGDRDNCTETLDTGQWSGHFSKCPEELTYYCIHGECRYIKQQKQPSCRCDSGYIGSRCEYVDLGLRIGEKRQMIIACIIAALVFLMVLIVFICIYSHRRCRFCHRTGSPREKPQDGTEKLSMMDTSTTHTRDSTETTHTNSV